MTVLKVEVNNLSKGFTSPTATIPVIQDISLHVAQGEFVSLLGPSGCGKSTLFNIICGLVKADQGLVLINGKQQPTPWQHLSYMPQKDLLLPWRQVLDNVILPLDLAGVDRKTAKREAMELMDFFGLKGFENHYPAQLSGGMRQRAALMRTILSKKDLVLLDEPFGALDAITRFKMQTWLLNLCSRFNRTILFITHDVEEAIYLSDRIYVLSERPGRVQLELQVPLARPRQSHMVTEQEFVATKKAILDSLAY